MFFHFKVIIYIVKKIDRILNLKIRVRATDGGGLFGEALVKFTVNRNLYDPTFSQSTYSTTIFDNKPLSSSFFQIHADDQDTQAS